jgi:hypothetical protein
MQALLHWLLLACFVARRVGIDFVDLHLGNRDGASIPASCNR